jgi:hypothetical protein
VAGGRLGTLLTNVDNEAVDKEAVPLVVCEKVRGDTPGVEVRGCEAPDKEGPSVTKVPRGDVEGCDRGGCDVADGDVTGVGAPVCEVSGVGAPVPVKGQTVTVEGVGTQNQP